MACRFPCVAMLWLAGLIVSGMPAGALLHGEIGAMAPSAGTVLAEDPEGVSPFPIAPRPDDGAVAAPPGTGGDPTGISPFPIPGVDGSPGPVSPGRVPGAAGTRVPTEREVGVPPFPYDPEARGGVARQCVRGCADVRSDCAGAGEPTRKCEGEFVLCARDCVLAPGPADFQPPGN